MAKIWFFVLVMLAVQASSAPAPAPINHVPSTSFFVNLRVSDLNNEVSDDELYEYALSYEFTKFINAPFGADPLLHPIPQTLDVFVMMSWFKRGWVGAAFVPAPLMHLLVQSGLIGSLKPAIFWPVEPLSLVYVRERDLACGQVSLSKRAFSSRDAIFLGNEYRNEGHLAYEHLSGLNKSFKNAATYYLQEPSHQLKAFFEFAKAGPGHSFGVFTARQTAQLRQNKDVCVVEQTFLPEVAGQYLLLDTTTKIDEARIAQALNVLRAAMHVPTEGKFKKYLAKQPDPVFMRAQLDEKLAQLHRYYGDDTNLLTIDLQNLKMRIPNAVQDTPISIPLMGGGARSPYTFAMGFQFMHEVIDPLGMASQAVLVGTSGGSVSALLISILDSDTSLNELRSVSRPMSDYVRPDFRSDVFEFFLVYKWLALTLSILGLIYLLAALGYLLVTRSPTPIWERLLLVLGVVAIGYFVPAYPFEYLVCVAFACCVLGALGFALRRSRHWHRVCLALLVIVLMSLAKFPFKNTSAFKGFDVRSYVTDLLKDNNDSGKVCAEFKTSEDVSRCLYKRVRYPLVITATDAKNMETVNFYVNPPGSRIAFPQKLNWIDLEQCPENLLNAVQASSAIPLMFAPVELKCDAKKLTLVDGSMLSRLPLEQAQELGAKVHFLLWNQRIDVRHGFITKEAGQSTLTIAEQLAMHWTIKYILASDTRSVNLGFEQKFYIAQPRIDLISSGDFWGGQLPTGEFIVPLELMKIAERDFHASEGVFSEISDGNASIDAFYNLYKDRIEAIIRPLEAAFCAQSLSQCKVK